jgi:signal peptidase I
MRAIGLPVAVRRARYWTDTTALSLLAAALLLLVCLGALLASGHRVLVVRSGSMSPAIEAGDIVVTTMVGPSEMEVGDVVTFRDPSRSQELVTHRAMAIERASPKVQFITKGDANTGTEQWDIDSDGKLGRLWFRIPNAGYALAWIGDPRVRAALLAVGAMILGFVALRRIWVG